MERSKGTSAGTIGLGTSLQYTHDRKYPWTDVNRGNLDITPYPFDMRDQLCVVVRFSDPHGSYDEAPHSLWTKLSYWRCLFVGQAFVSQPYIILRIKQELMVSFSGGANAEL